MFVITLIHGTFGRESSLLSSDHSGLIRRLEALLDGPLVFERFYWSGRNSFASRSESTFAFYSWFTRTTEKYPDATHIIIAHSHGGNVLLKSIERNARIGTRLGAIVLLNTPFVIAVKRKIPFFLSLIAALAYGLPDDPIALASAGVFVIMMTVMLSTGGHVLWGLFILVVMAMTFLSISIGLKGDGEKMIDEVKTSVPTNIPTLVLNTKRDEAIWYLAMIDKVSSLIRMPIDRIVQFVWLASILVFVKFIAYDLIWGEVDFLFLGMVVLTNIFLVLFNLIVPSLQWILRASPLGYGESFLATALLRISVATLPESLSNNVTVFYVKMRRIFSLHHSEIYKDEKVAIAICDWINGYVKPVTVDLTDRAMRG